RIVSVKRPLFWMEIARAVLARMPQAHFVIVGDDGDLGPEVREYARKHGLAGRLHMPRPVADVGDWYRAIDVLLLTSERDGLPNVNIEAQHFGVPVVSSDVGGAAQTFEHGATGFLVDPAAGPQVFAARVLEALLDTRWRDGVRRTAPEMVHAAFGESAALER